MQNLPINDVLADNLAYFMQKRGLNQTGLAKKSGVRQNTISLYLDPSKRKPSAKGKPASGKLTEVAMLADGLGVEAWELIRSLDQDQREAYSQIEAAFRAIQPEKKPDHKPNGADKKAA